MTTWWRHSCYDVTHKCSQSLWRVDIDAWIPLDTNTTSEKDRRNINSSSSRLLAYAVITIAICLRYDYDTTTTYREGLLPFDAIRREQKMNMSIFRRSRIAVESQLW